MSIHGPFVFCKRVFFGSAKNINAQFAIHFVTIFPYGFIRCMDGEIGKTGIAGTIVFI